jgi:hypothetical protein
MIQRAAAIGLSLCFIFTCKTMANEDPAGPLTSDLSTSTSPTTTEAGKPDAHAPVEGNEEPNSSQGPRMDPAGATPSPDNLSFTFLDFEIDLKGFQHEPARKNRDKFEAKLRFAALLPHASRDPQSWTGFGEMKANVISRAPHSFQAPHRAVKSFHVIADSYSDYENNMISVIVHPKDAVTYSLTTGEVLGTTGVLKLMLADATCAGLTGTILAFSIPENTPASTEFHCQFDTSGRHVCWFEGSATLKVLSKKVGKFLKVSDLPKATDSEGENAQQTKKTELTAESSSP